MKKMLLLLLCAFMLCTFCFSASADEDYVLNIWSVNIDERYYYAEQKTKEKYPGLEIVADYIDGSSFINRLFSRDSGIDIVGIQDWSNGVSGRFLIQSGLLEDLTQHPALAAIQDELLGINDVYVLDGQWFGVNCQTYQQLWYGNKALFQEMGLPFPQDKWTWDDFYNLGKQVYEYNQQNGTSYKLIYEDDMCPYVIKQYLYNTTDYANDTHQLDDPRFYQLVEQWLQLRAWGVSIDVDSNPEYRQMTIPPPDTLIYVKKASLHDIHFFNVSLGIKADQPEAKYQFIVPPTENGMHASLSCSFGMGIASYSKLKEEALYFFECYLSKEAYESNELLDIPYMDTAVGPLPSSFRNNGPIYKNDPVLDRLQIPEDSWAKQNLDHWIAMLNDCEGEYYDGDMAHTVCYDILDGLRAMKSNKITLDQYIKNCCRIADQYLGE